ncbi:MAG: response regulator, partial [Desulfamplus sp.]|nr:response regulator [Desulfamplus sp.]
QQEAVCKMLCRLVIIDITELKQAELEKKRLEAQLHQSQKLESIGRLAGGVAHDFNNMLMVIIGYAEISLDSLDTSDPLHENLREIRNAAKRSADLTRQLLAFARKQTIAPIVLDINQTVESMLKMLEKLIGENINLHWQQGKDLWSVKVDSSQFDQILVNLCVNAKDAIDGIGNVLISTANVTCDKVYCSNHVYAIEGDYVLLTVSDDGVGMDKEILANIFEPFFTTKEFGKGTGLGLATVYGIVKQNNGFIDVHSEPGKGTTFKIYLPRHIENVPQIEKEDQKEPAVDGHETILLVEDEPVILTVGKIMLENLGYQVLTADLPIKAINIAKDHAGEIALLITDVVMPEMSGRDLAQNILSIIPHIKCLFMSGYTADIIAKDGILDEGMHFIQKPFSRKELALKVRNALISF